MSLPDQEPFTHARACLLTQSNTLTLTHHARVHTHTELRPELTMVLSQGPLLSEL